MRLCAGHRKMPKFTIRTAIIVDGYSVPTGSIVMPSVNNKRSESWQLARPAPRSFRVWHKLLGSSKALWLELL